MGRERWDEVQIQHEAEYHALRSMTTILFSWIDVLFCEVHIESSFSSWIDELFLVNCMWSRPFFPDLRTFLARCISSPLFSPWIDRCLLLTCMRSFFTDRRTFFRYISVYCVIYRVGFFFDQRIFYPVF